jgi:hypothetical protein
MGEAKRQSHEAQADDVSISSQEDRGCTAGEMGQSESAEKVGRLGLLVV